MFVGDLYVLCLGVWFVFIDLLCVSYGVYFKLLVGFAVCYCVFWLLVFWFGLNIDFVVLFVGCWLIVGLVIRVVGSLDLIGSALTIGLYCC